MKIDSEVVALLGIDYPIIQGPLGGGLSTAALAATVSNAGGLGSYGAHILEPLEIEVLCEELRTLTERPFAINLWVSDHDPELENLSVETFEDRRNDYGKIYETLEIEPPVWPPSGKARYEQQVEAVIRSKPKVFSFVFGIPSREIINECARQNIVTIGAATTIEEAIALEESGVDIALATGLEAGGHRPSFLRRAEESLIGSMSLLPTVKDRIKIPIVAAGGIADGRGLRAAFALGADAVQIGSAFLACEESGAGAAHRHALINDTLGRATLSRSFTGRLARFLPNRFVEEFQNAQQTALPFPAQSWLTTPIKRAASEQGDTDYMALYSSQSSPLIHHRSANELMQELIAALPNRKLTLA